MFQVLLIRKKLRERNTALKQVVVEKVQGVQGNDVLETITQPFDC